MLQISCTVTKVHGNRTFSTEILLHSHNNLIQCAFTFMYKFLLTYITSLRVVLFWVSVSERESVQMVYLLNVFALCVKLNGSYIKVILKLY